MSITIRARQLMGHACETPRPARHLGRLRHAAAATLLMAFALLPQSAAATPASLQLDDMTWTEVRDALRAGTTTIIVPIGGTEQNGPHMALGKHNVRAGVLAGRIAAKLGNALVAPVVSYVPEGRISPPAGHMKFAGTISISDDAFIAVLTGAARSFKQHGFLDIVLVGDSGNYQGQMKDAAQRLNREWADSRTRAHHVAAYYRAANDDFVQALRARGLREEQIGRHAGVADTSLMLAVDPSRVRMDRLRGLNNAGSAPSESSVSGGPGATGVSGDPAESTAALGRMGADMIVDKSVEAIRKATSARP